MYISIIAVNFRQELLSMAKFLLHGYDNLYHVGEI